MNNLINHQRFHVGAYGILIHDKRILLVKKSRGSYKGMFDLPGGGIEFGEKAEDALRREFIEETGIVLDSETFIGYSEYFCKYSNESNEPRELHHLGLFFKVDAKFSKIKKGPDGHDSLGAEFVDINDLNRVKISQIALPIIEEAIKKG